MKAAIISLFLIFAVRFANGCECFQSLSFDLMIYDQAVHVVELRIEKETEKDFNQAINQYRKDTTAYGPDSFEMPSKKFDQYEVSIVEVLKGSPGVIKELRYMDLDSDCHISLMPGRNYIIYFHTDSMLKNGIGELHYCDRRLQGGTERYQSELAILKLFKEKPTGPFYIDQSDIIDGMDRWILIEGSFKDSKRHGKWVIYEPIVTGQPPSSRPEKMMVIKYKLDEAYYYDYFPPSNRWKQHYLTEPYIEFYKPESWR